MAYTVLARKYRSQTFDEVIGQDPIAQTLKNAIKTDRVAHAYLFTGTRGVGKTTMARVLSKALNCLSFDSPTAEPCCKCESCIAINLGDDIDVIEIDGASNNGIDEVRKLRENAIYRPARARFKIYIIDEVHMLSPSAFNALLKILEEPPAHVKFIFATTEPNKVIATVQSRCQRFDFRNITAAAIAEQLKLILQQEKIKYEEDLVLPIAKMANGSMRDALSLLDRLISTGAEPLTAKLLEEFLGCPNSEKVWNLVAKIGENDAAGTLAAIEDLISTGLSEVQIADALIDNMRDLMVVKSAGAESELLVAGAEHRKHAGELAEMFDIAGLVYNITTLEKLRWTIKNSETARALLEASLLRLALSEHFLNVDSLLSQAPKGQAKGNSVSPIKKNEVTSNRPTSQPQTHSPPAEQGKNKQPDSTGLNEPPPAKSSQQSASETDTGDEQRRRTPINQAKTSSQRKNEIVNDPAVKTVLMELGATITEIEESENQHET
ncbi:MAG: DNA polymerase III subunit gamma/tau [Sedimentisphaerales bacterium]|nr:DNA polymerase III subunit gamma/tau [Sedimentisphaerales bacterium]